MNMKQTKFIMLGAMVMLPMIITAQSYRSFSMNSGKESSNSIIYNLPKTDLVIRFKVEKTTRTKGIYSDNAYMLGIDNIALKNTTTYRIVSADISERISADANKRYIMNVDNNVRVEKTTFGTIKSVLMKGQNINNGLSTKVMCDIPSCKYDSDPKEMQNRQSLSLEVKSTYEKLLMQQGLLTKYPQMTADKVVVEIKRLRDKQIELLSGGWEGTYMNTTVDFMYKQLDEIISSYVALFTGIEKTETEEYIFVITPEKPIILEEDLLLPVCKFSATNGLMDLNEKGEGAKVNVRIHSYVTTEENAKNSMDSYMNEQMKKKLNKEGVGIYYMVPQKVKVTLQGMDMTNVSKIVKLMQYGNVAYTLSYENNILFDQNTGELIRIW